MGSAEWRGSQLSGIMSLSARVAPERRALPARQPTGSNGTAREAGIKKYKVLQTVKRSLEFSSPLPGRPEVWWTPGIDATLVREQWGTAQGEAPYEESTIDVPPEIASFLPGNPKKLRTIPIGGPVRRWVVYDRGHPEIRLILILGEPYQQDGVKLQPILRSLVERDRGVDPKATREIEDRLWDEVCRVERRGRPVGTGHPKRRPFPSLGDLPITPQHVKALRKEGLDDRDLRILFDLLRHKKQYEIARELKVSASAVSQRLKNHIEPAIRNLNPKFSLKSLKSWLLVSK